MGLGQWTKNAIKTSSCLGIIGVISGCEDIETKVSYSKPILTKVEISQEYTSSQTNYSFTPRFNSGGGMSMAFTPITHKEEYLTTIKSKNCSEQINEKRVYNYFKKNKTNHLTYVNLIKNTYEKSLFSEKRLIKSRMNGCKFIIPETKEILLTTK